LRAQQVLRVGTNEIGSPWSFHDAASNSERGIAIELVHPSESFDSMAVGEI
jgi:hypothetical protein